MEVPLVQSPAANSPPIDPAEEEAVSGRPRTRRSSRRILLDATVVLLAAVAGAVAFSAAAHGQLTVGPAHFAVSVSPALSPLTVVELPPLGSVVAATHAGPLRLGVRLQDFDVVGTAAMIERGELSISTTRTPTVGDVPLQGLSGLALRLVGGGLLAAAVCGALVALAFRRSRAIIALATALALLVPATAMGVAYATWDISAFRAPTLRGSLEYAPDLMSMFSTRVANIERLRDQAAKVAMQLGAYYADKRSLLSGGALRGTYRVLHVTDLHLDPVGAQLAKSLARSYEASLVVDTGDLPILGAGVETNLFAELIDTSVPRVYVPGNHDSPASIDALRRLGVTVLTSGTVEVDGLSIFGVPDPISRGFGVEPDRELLLEDADEAFAQLRELLESGEATPAIVAIHNPAMEKPFIGSVSLIVSGHTHSPRYYVSQGTARLNSGTLGGMPYDPEATERTQLPYGASVLYFTAEEPRRLIAIDRIAVFTTGSSTISREVIAEELLP